MKRIHLDLAISAALILYGIAFATAYTTAGLLIVGGGLLNLILDVCSLRSSDHTKPSN